MIRTVAMLAAIVSLLIAGVAPVTAVDTAGGIHKVFVCKYVGTPHVDERLQTGDNPIDVDIDSIPGFPADIETSVGFEFADAQGRSIVIAVDHGQPEPPVTDCPPPIGPPPTPSPTPVPTETPTPIPTDTPTPVPTETPTPIPTETPTPVPTETPPPEIGQFSVAVCPVTGEPVPVGQSAITIRGTVLLILLLHVRVDGVEVTLDDVLGDGTVGEVFVTPGVHTITVSNAADTEVLASETVNCPECNATVTTPTPPPGTPPPHKTTPPTDTLEASSPSSNGSLQVILLILAGLSAGALLVPRRKR